MTSTRGRAQNPKNYEFFESSSLKSQKDQLNSTTIDHSFLKSITPTAKPKILTKIGNNNNLSNKRYIVDDKDAQSDTIHERSKNRNDFQNNLNNDREIATELQSNESSNNDEDVIPFPLIINRKYQRLDH